VEQRPGIFRLYEEHIGTITPIVVTAWSKRRIAIQPSGSKTLSVKRRNERA